MDIKFDAPSIYVPLDEDANVDNYVDDSYFGEFDIFFLPIKGQLGKMT